jgi:acyl-CoA synthetase (AMP-forming)/AMP-acid ligase II
MISYTSGTTGMPKGVLLSQGGLAATGVQVVTLMGLAPDDVWYQATSLAWSACQLALLGLVNGMTTVLPGGIGSFDISHFLHTIGRHHVSGTMLAPVMVRRVLDELDRGSYDLSSFRKITYGSSPAPPALVRRVREALPRVELMQLYGATEGGFVTVLTHTEHMRGFNGEEALLRSCGRPGGWVDMQVMDDEGRPVAPGETGEVWLRSPMNCLGYHGLPEQTEALLAGEWIRSHDIGWMDDEGFLYLTDRKNFMIITGGMNVYPNVVENVLATHPAVADVAVVGAEHPEWGEAVVAVVEPRPGVEAEPPELIAFCRERLGAFEVPKYVRIVDVLPRGVTGKILKPALIAEFVEHPDQLPWNRVQPPVVVGGGAVT